MHQSEIIVLLFGVVAAGVLVARKLELPYPIVLVLVGLGLSFIPHLPEVRLDPNIFFYFFLPPLLYPAALFTSWRDFRRDLRAILSLATGLVLFTMLVVACVTHWLIPEIPWAAAFALGAIVSPPDAVAATSVIQRLPVPRRIVSILEGESLVNDATALVALKFAVAAMTTGQFSFGAASLHFIWAVAGGVGLGFLVGFVIRWVHRRLDDPPVQITISLLTPFIAYLSAEQLHGSGVLAVVTAGIYLGWHSPLILSARFRLQAFAFWEIVVFLLNGFVFIAIGFQLPGIMRSIRHESLVMPIENAAIVCAAVVLVRIAWVFPGAYLPMLFTRDRESLPPWRNIAVIAWTGMRGVISLAAAFALPFVLDDGRPFPGRNYILFVTFCVILTTLVFQGLTLPIVIRRLCLGGDGSTAEEERVARLEANKAATALLEQLAGTGEFSQDANDRLRAEYAERIQQLQMCAEDPDECRGEVTTPQYQRLQQRALDVERDTIIRLRNQQVINDDALRRIQRDLDLAEARLKG
ncbi:MAG TPA: Na+/H+ antiporter [Chthoniobacterales bacterium]|nr:Na+/H+ antiporter [Chthoniobacterales bacterium]